MKGTSIPSRLQQMLDEARASIARGEGIRHDEMWAMVDSGYDDDLPSSGRSTEESRP
jgi:hypothetical protein